jgi:molybdenum ABC transporter molybdate-binding protein
MKAGRACQQRCHHPFSWHEAMAAVRVVGHFSSHRFRRGPVAAAPVANDAVLREVTFADLPASRADDGWTAQLSPSVPKDGPRADSGLVLIAPANSNIELKIIPKFKLAAALGGGRLSTGDPDTVPAGRYARAALISLSAWDSVQTKLVRAENVRSAIMFVARGEAPLGIVYATDALVDAKVRIVDTFPDGSHAPITYPAAAMKAAKPEAASYLEYLGGEEAAATWKKFGFISLAAAR